MFYVVRRVMEIGAGQTKRQTEAGMNGLCERTEEKQQSEGGVKYIDLT